MAANVGDTLYFHATDPAHGAELWTSDGTGAGTKLVKDINPGTGSSHPYFLADVGDRFFFQAYHRTHGRELWKAIP